MNYAVKFQYLPPGGVWPRDHIQDETITVEDGAYIPLPSVGDSAAYLERGKVVSRKVLTRHFVFVGDHLSVNIVVTDISQEEMASRLRT